MTRVIALVLMGLLGGVVPPLPALAQDLPLIVQDFRAMDGKLRAVKRQIEVPLRRDENVKLLGDMKKIAQGARTKEPLQASGLSGEKRDEFLKAYREEMSQLIHQIDRLIEAVTKNDIVKAKNLINSIDERRAMAHKRFRHE